LGTFKALLVASFFFSFFVLDDFFFASLMTTIMRGLPTEPQTRFSTSKDEWIQRNWGLFECANNDDIGLARRYEESSIGAVCRPEILRDQFARRSFDRCDWSWHCRRFDLLLVAAAQCRECCVVGSWLDRLSRWVENASPIFLSSRYFKPIIGATGRNGGHCWPSAEADDPLDFVQLKQENFRAVEALIRDRKIDCDWKRTKGGLLGISKQSELQAELEWIEKQSSYGDNVEQAEIWQDQNKIKTELPINHDYIAAVVEPLSGKFYRDCIHPLTFELN
jgi:hypothetical protein